MIIPRSILPGFKELKRDGTKSELCLWRCCNLNFQPDSKRSNQIGFELGYQPTLQRRKRWGRRRSSWSGSRAGCSPPCSPTCQGHWCLALQTWDNLCQWLWLDRCYDWKAMPKKLVIHQRFPQLSDSSCFAIIFRGRNALWQYQPWISEDEEITKRSHLQIIQWHLCDNSLSPLPVSFAPIYLQVSICLTCLDFTNILPEIRILRVGLNVFIPACTHWALGVARQCSRTPDCFYQDFVDNAQLQLTLLHLLLLRFAKLRPRRLWFCPKSFGRPHSASV